MAHRGTSQGLCQSDAMSDGLSGVSTGLKQESVALCPLEAAAAPQQEPLCIFGTGDFGRSLGQCLLQAGYKVVYGSRRPQSCGPVPPGTQVRRVWLPHLNLGHLVIFFYPLLSLLRSVCDNSGQAVVLEIKLHCSCMKNKILSTYGDQLSCTKL